MTAIILAAGRGHRLSQVTGDAPKCLARVGERTLLARQLELLQAAGLMRLAVVVGHQATAVARAAYDAAGSVSIVHNRRYAVTNSLYSLWLSRHLLQDGFVVLNCDVLCHPQVLTDLLTCRHEDALLYAPMLPSQQYTEEEMKVVVRKGRVVTLGKGIRCEAADGENVGIARFGPAGAAVLCEELSRHVAAGAERAWLPAAFASFAARRPLFAVPTRGFPWIEIDSPDDYWRACDDVLPALEPVHHV